MQCDIIADDIFSGGSKHMTQVLIYANRINVDKLAHQPYYCCKTFRSFYTCIKKCTCNV